MSKVREYTVHCKHCQSMPDGYYCGLGKTFHKNRNGENVRARDCWYIYLYDEDWEFHPCPFFEGEIRFHQDKEGNYYDQNHYAKIQIPYADAEFTPELLVEVQY